MSLFIHSISSIITLILLVSLIQLKKGNLWVTHQQKLDTCVFDFTGPLCQIVTEISKINPIIEQNKNLILLAEALGKIPHTAVAGQTMKANLIAATHVYQQIQNLLLIKSIYFNKAVHQCSQYPQLATLMQQAPLASLLLRIPDQNGIGLLLWRNQNQATQPVLTGFQNNPFYQLSQYGCLRQRLCLESAPMTIKQNKSSKGFPYGEKYSTVLYR